MSLRDHWLSLWARLGGNPAQGVRPYERLVARYAEPHRHYHTIEHVQDCLSELDADLGAAEPKDKDAVEMAVWFHDAIYDPQAKDNESKSAELARLALDVGGFDDAFIAKVGDLVMATAHVETPRDHDAQVLVDVDLSILGRPERDFDAYERRIRREYDRVPDEAFIRGRSRVMKSFLARASIFSTPSMAAKYEAAARRNIVRSLDRLGQGIILR